MIFEADTPAGKAFDVMLIASIIISVVIVVLDSIDSLSTKYSMQFVYLEWTFTILFTIEYLLRLYCSKNTKQYTLSFFGIIDLSSLIPTYLSIFVPSMQYLTVVRVFRLLRIFRILKLMKHIEAANTLNSALIASRYKIMVFLLTVFSIVIIIGSLMYVIEGTEHGFENILSSIYWTVVTLTTVGYGDITPQTTLGKALASIVMILGYGIVAIPTGIVGAQIAQTHSQLMKIQLICPSCGNSKHSQDAKYCAQCGTSIF